MERKDIRDHGYKHLAALRPTALRKSRHAATDLMCMCSISGIIQLSNSKHDQEELSSAVSRMNAALHHRGPDDYGVANVCAPASSPEHSINLSLGNTRLAIIDVSSAGHQPMHDPDTGNWITYNGETYNYRQLRTELGDEFGPWSSNTDTEVVLRAYRKWGTDAFARLRGMFALAIWDQSKRTLVLARDRTGLARRARRPRDARRPTRRSDPRQSPAR